MNKLYKITDCGYVRYSDDEKYIQYLKDSGSDYDIQEYISKDTNKEV